MKLFSKLISPVATREFFNSYWTKHELHLSNRFDTNNLFSVEKLNRLLITNQNHLSFPVIRLIKNGKIVPETNYTNLVEKRRQTVARQISIDKIISYCNNGATFTFNGMDNYSFELSEYCLALAKELNEKTQINCYLTQKNEQGLESHYDHHEIFIIQVQGEKEWEVFGKAENYPLPTNKYYEQGEPNYSDKRKYLLKVGDVLYIPRGMWHQAKTTNTSSLHLTLNVICKLKIDFLHWLVDKIAAQDKNLRTNLFLNPNKTSENMLSFAKNFGDRLEEKDSDLIKKFIIEKGIINTSNLPFKI